jgi:hypothetical protein
MLGQQVPGMSGGLPAQGGLSVTANPMAKELQSYGRGDDSMLVHMTPGEVNSLQGLAMAHGGSLTINPDTGLPEAGFLKKLLPTLLGIGLNFIPGVGPLAAAGLVAAGSVAKTGSLSKGLMAGLQAYGGASLAGGFAPAATGTKLASTVGGAGSVGGFGPTANMARGLAADSMLANTAGTTAAKTGLAGLAQNFGAAAKAGLPAGTPGIIAKNAPMIAGMGVLSGVSAASQPTMKEYNPDEEGYQFKYEGPYRTIPRKFDPRVEGEGEIQFFDEVNPIGYLTASGERRGYAEGGPIDNPDNPLDDLGFDRSDYAKTFDAKLAALKAAGAADTDFAKTITSGLQSALGNQKLHRGQFQTLFSNDIAALDDLIARGKPTTAPTATDDFTRPPYDKVFDGGGGGGVKPPEDKVTVTDTLKTTIDPTMGGVTPGTGTGATLTDRPDIPGATYDSPGVQTLKDLYTPKFTQKDDFVTEKRDPYTMGSELFAKLPEATARYQTSPGAVTASRTYVGGSPSERIRAAAQANAAARAAAAAAAAAGTTTPSTTATTSTTPSTGGELNFDLPSTAGTTRPANTAGPASNRGYTGFDGLAGLAGNNPYTSIYDQQTNRQPNLNAGNVMDTGNEGGEMDFGFGPPAQGQTNPNVNLASLIGTDAFFDALNQQYGGGGGGGYSAEYGMPRNQELARGGPVNMHNGAFVVDARTVSELGNGSSNAGIELLQRLGGQPVRGGGDGVSDSVPARIGGKQEARVARDEVIFQPKAVKRLGGGSAKRGTQKLYAMMEKAHKARKRAGRGQDTKLAKGLA